MIEESFNKMKEQIITPSSVENIYIEPKIKKIKINWMHLLFFAATWSAVLVFIIYMYKINS